MKLPDGIDQVSLNFSPDSLWALNAILGIIMFGVALELKPEHFKYIYRYPKASVAGILSQIIFLPAGTFFLILILKPHSSLALGMILVAACPGGNISNFLTALSKGNTALSISLTAFSTLTAAFLTPFNFRLYSSLYYGVKNQPAPFVIHPADMVFTVLVLLAIPTILGIIFAIRFPRLTARIKKPVRMLSLLFFALFVILALVSNFRAFREYIHLVFYLVLCHNTLALATGYFTSNLFGLPKPDRKTLTIETGIQNSGLGLVLIFNFFHGLGGMALVAAWWGIWHILSGLVISGYWSRKSNSVEIA